MTSFPEPFRERRLAALLREAPFVRQLARALSAGDREGADELVQQTWLRVLERAPDRVRRPRSWLAQVMRSLASNTHRGDRRRRAREQSVARAERVPSSAELALREERRRQLVGLVDALPEDQRAVVLLRFFEGLPPREIAAHMGRPVAAIQNLQRRALAELRRRLDASAAQQDAVDRAAWLLPLALGGGRSPNSSPAVSCAWGLLPGVLAMTKTKALAVLATVGAVIAYLAWPAGAPGAPHPGIGPAAPAAELAAADVEGDGATAPSESQAPALRSEQTPSSVVAAARGRLVVTVRHGEPADLAVGVAIYVRSRSEDPFGAQRQETGVDGVAAFDLAPGSFVVCDDRFGRTLRVEVEPGVETALEWSLPSELNLSGKVVDPAGRPIAGAWIEVAMPALVGRYPQTVARTGADGVYSLRSLPSLLAVGARAHGYVAARTEMAYAEFGSDRVLDFTLQPGGGSVVGEVLGADGAPLEGALVCVGKEPLQRGMNAGGDGPLPALARTDAKGRFVAVGLTAGDQPVWVRGRGHALWRGSCAVASHGRTELGVQLRRGATLRGVVRSAVGEPVAEAEVRLGDWFDPDFVRILSGHDGAYEIAGVTAGIAVVAAEDDDLGKARREVVVPLDDVLDLDLVLSKGLQILGQVVDERGQGVAKVHVEATAPRTVEYKGWMGYARTDDDGRFAIANCPPGRTFELELTGKAIEAKHWPQVEPSPVERSFAVRRAEPPAARIVGSVVGADGRPIVGGIVSVWTQGNHGTPEVATDELGAFSVGPVAAGTWRGRIRAEGLPPLEIGPRPLARGERWDLGPLVMPEGGRAAIVAEGEDLSEMGFMLLRPATGARWVPAARAGVVETSILVPDRYLLMAWGPRTPAQVQPFDIVANRVVEVRLQGGAGVLQRFEFETAAGGLPAAGGQLAVFRGEDKLVDVWLQAPSEAPWTYDVCLLPGEYSATLRGAGFSGEVDVRIGSVPAPPLRIAVR